MIDIKIGEYHITTDEVQFVLKKERIIKDEKSKKCGETELDNEGYYGSLEGLMSSLLKKMIVTSKEDIKTLSKLADVVQTYSNVITKELGGI